MKTSATLTFLILLLFACQSESYSVPLSLDEDTVINEFNDIESYETIQLHGVLWLAENYAGNVFQNGDTIFHAESPEAYTWACDHEIPAWITWRFQHPFSKQILKEKFYNFYAINDPRGLAPKGWKIPSLEDWKFLLKHYEYNEVKVKGLRSEYGWDYYDSGSNKFGFNALPLGACDVYAGCANDNVSALFWTSTESNEVEAWSIFINAYDQIDYSEMNKNTAMPIRLINNQK